MGHKVHPVGFRLGIIRDWQSRWYADAHYADFLHEDIKLRGAINSKYPEAAISLIEIDRQAKDITVTLHTARPGIVIGRGGQRVDEMRVYLEKILGKRIRLNISEIRQPELDAYLVGRTIAEQIERRVAYRRAMKQAIFRSMQAGAKGIRVSCAGRLGDAEIARRQIMHQGQVPLHTLRADIDYAFTEAHTTLGRIGIKTWIYKGEIIKPKKAEVPEAESAEGKVAPPPAVAEPIITTPVEKPAEPVVAEAVAPAPSVEAAEPGKVAEVVAGAAEVVAPPAAQTAKPVRRRRKPAVSVEETASKEESEDKAEAEPSKPARKGKKDATT